jgi:hypothetical protein
MKNLMLRVAGLLGTRVCYSGPMSSPLSGLPPGPLVAHSLFPYEIF